METIRDYGCRILILSSSIIDENDELWIEKECGVGIKISMKELYLLLKPKVEGFKLNVAVAFINIVNGSKIAKIFKKLGVPQVFTYSKKQHTETGMVDDHSREYMRSFSIQFIKHLMKECTF